MDDEFIKCCICFEDYNKTDRIPKMLTCQHSFCSQCLSQIYNTDRDNVTCALCRQKMNIKYEDVPNNRIILNFLDMLNGPKEPNWKFVKELKGHNDAVISVCFNKRNLLATGSWDSTIRVWNTDTWDLVKVLSGHKEAVYSVCFSQTIY